MGFGCLDDLCLLGFSCTFINDIFGSNVLRLLGLRMDESKFEVKVIQHKGIMNEAPCRDEKTAVDCFIQFLRGADALPLLVNFSRDKLRNQLEPDIARNYRYASLMSRFLADTGNGRIKFEELVDRIAVSSTTSD